MAIQLVKLRKVKQPLRNEQSNSILFEDNLRFISAHLFNQIRQTPELLSMLDTAVTDHFLGPIDLFDVNGRTLGPTKLKQAEKFWQDNNVQCEAFSGQGMDYFVDGSSFGFHASALNSLPSKNKEMLMTKLKALPGGIGRFAEESANKPRKISYLAASTITIKHDASDILYYIQNAAGDKVRWETDQVVHIKLIEFNGEIRGMSPLKALTRDIVIMYMLKENITAMLQNGGSMDTIISLKGANGVSKARFNRLQTALESFSHLKKSHGNMAIDGEVQVHPMGIGLKDMEYRELAMFIISEFALALGLPTSRVPFLMTGSGGSSNKGELSGNSEDSYQSKINARRSNWENSWNKVFRKAGFTFKFRRDNLGDDVRETQASTQRAAYVSEVQTSLAKAGKQLTLAAHLALLSGTKMNINSDDVEKLEVQEDPMDQGAMAGAGGKMQPANKDSQGRVARDVSDFKKRTATNNGVHA